MDYSYSSEILQAIGQAPLIEQVAIDDNHKVIYMGFPRQRDITKCCIKKIDYVKDGQSETWVTKWSNGMQEQNCDWEDRETITYNFLI